jgi:hypothetical protein
VYCATNVKTSLFSSNKKGVLYKSCDPCREISKLKNKTWRANNKDNEKAYNAKYRKDNLENVKLMQKEWRDEHKGYGKDWYKNNKPAVAITAKAYRVDKRDHCDHKRPKSRCKICHPTSYLRHLVSRRIGSALSSNKSKGSLEYLGCDIKTFKEHLEKSFKENMTWKNQGRGGWEIDHIIPVLYQQDGIKPSIEEVSKRLHYTNCQAMWATENVKKGNRYCGNYQPSVSDSD